MEYLRFGIATTMFTICIIFGLIASKKNENIYHNTFMIIAHIYIAASLIIGGMNGS